jgi:translation initiation factor 4E
MATNSSLMPASRLRPGARASPLLPEPHLQRDEANNSNNTNSSSDSKTVADVKLPKTAEVKAKLATMRHPLQHTWVLHFDKRRKAAPAGRMQDHDAWSNRLTKLGKFNSIEDFWRYYNNIRKPSQIDVGANLHVFKDGIEPAWEDAANENGGQWLLSFFEGNRKYLDSVWEKLILAVVGETLESGEDICGIVVSRRGKNDRIAIWNRTSEEAPCMALGTALKKAALEGLVPPPKIKIEYNSHSQSLRSGSSAANKTRFTV